MLIGLALTYFWIPDTRGEGGRPQTLAQLAKGRASDEFSQTRVALWTRLWYHKVFDRRDE